MNQVNEAYERLLKNDVRYRFVDRHEPRPVSEAVHPVPEDFNAPYRADASSPSCTTSPTSDPDRFWLDQARRLTWNKFPTKAGDWSFDEEDFHIALVRGRRAQPVGQLPRPAPRGAWRPDGADLRGRRARPGPPLHLSRALRRDLPLREPAEAARDRARRPRDDLHADDPRSGGGDARLRADRRDPFGGIRRLLARERRGPHRRLRRLRRDHRRRRRARRQEDSA